MTDEQAPSESSEAAKKVRGPLWRLGMSVLRIVVVVYVVFGAGLYFFQSYAVFMPSDEEADTPADAGLAFDEVTLATPGGAKIDAWYVPARRHGGLYTLVFCHGNAGNMSHRVGSIDTFSDLGLNVLIFDYPGYGRSEGTVSEEGTYQAAEAAWRHLVETRNISPNKIVIFGRSLGGAVAANLAHAHEPAGLILESTFTSVPDMGAKLYPFLPVRWLCRISYDTRAIIGEINCPILVVHSPDDDMVPYELGRAVFDAAGEPKTFLDIEGTHNEGVVVSDRIYTDGLAKFLVSIGKRGTDTTIAER